MFQLLYFDLFQFIPSGEFLQIYSSEMTKNLLLDSIHPILNSIYGEMNKFSRQIFRGEGRIQVKWIFAQMRYMVFIEVISREGKWTSI